MPRKSQALLEEHDDAEEGRSRGKRQRRHRPRVGICLAGSREVWLQQSEGNMGREEVRERLEAHVSSVRPLPPASSVSPLATWSYWPLAAFTAEGLCLKSATG